MARPERDQLRKAVEGNEAWGRRGEDWKREKTKTEPKRRGKNAKE
jgi:hypothetical protein